jgi:hypothetical protein
VFKHAPGKGLAAYLDSDLASDPITRQSVTGYFFTLAGVLLHGDLELRLLLLTPLQRLSIWRYLIAPVR